MNNSLFCDDLLSFLQQFPTLIIEYLKEFQVLEGASKSFEHTFN